MITDSVAVITTRKGDPKNLKTWDDLIKPGIKVLTPNPFSSGSAKWNILAAYGAQLKAGKTEAAGRRLPHLTVQERPGPGGQRPGVPAGLHRR